MAKKVKKKIRIRILPIVIIIFILTLLSGSVYLLSLIPIKNIYISMPSSFAFRLFSRI